MENPEKREMASTSQSDETCSKTVLGALRNADWRTQHPESEFKL